MPEFSVDSVRQPVPEVSIINVYLGFQKPRRISLMHGLSCEVLGEGYLHLLLIVERACFIFPSSHCRLVVMKGRNRRQSHNRIYSVNLLFCQDYQTWSGPDGAMDFALLLRSRCLSACAFFGPIKRVVSMLSINDLTMFAADFSFRGGGNWLAPWEWHGCLRSCLRGASLIVCNFRVFGIM